MHHYELQQALWHARKMKPCNDSFRINQLTSVYNYLPDYTLTLCCWVSGSQYSLKLLGTTHPTKQDHIPEDLNPL